MNPKAMDAPLEVGRRYVVQTGGQLEGGIVITHGFTIGLLTQPAFELKNSEANGCEATRIS